MTRTLFDESSLSRVLAPLLNVRPATTTCALLLTTSAEPDPTTALPGFAARTTTGASGVAVTPRTVKSPS